MPRYYFDLSNGAGFVHDPEGRDEGNLAAARQVAITALRGIISSEINEGKPVSRRSFISVRSEAGDEVAKVHFQDAILIED
ncbi:DUF6894 family protein [Allopontixanthobacter sediminis]|uniref:DUF6894 domain-containing protein n=1 Tax=Allopontixanthobacter sediminis TaxID=1689985 RepID=A0A845B1X5_9SPHN|nr:hypothetical protein [Allopontixanthobacter sediminis]MXP45723.1 hypothetical protein [Allopontixanthobacter sediminis]